MNLCVVFCYISVVGVVSVMFIDGFLNKIYDYVFLFFLVGYLNYLIKGVQSVCV